MGDDVFVYSMAKHNGNDVIKDFHVGSDKLYMTDLLDSYQGTGNYSVNNIHRTRAPGDKDEGIYTSNSDNNITIKDLLAASGGRGLIYSLSLLATVEMVVLSYL